MLRKEVLVQAVIKGMDLKHSFPISFYALVLAVAVLFIYIPIVTPAVCEFSLTNETLPHTCVWSRWLPWNCTCCGSDVGSVKFGKRQRGLCCDEGQSLSQCMTKCGYSLTDDTEYGECATACPSKTGPSICHTTAHSVGTTFVASSIPTTTKTSTIKTTAARISTTKLLTTQSTTASTRLTTTTMKPASTRTTKLTILTTKSSVASSLRTNLTSSSQIASRPSTEAISINTRLSLMKSSTVLSINSSATTSNVTDSTSRYKTTPVKQGKTSSQSKLLNDENKIPLTTMIGATCGAFLFFLLLALMIIFILKKKKRRTAPEKALAHN